jgi:hypothetical protein
MCIYEVAANIGSTLQDAVNDLPKSRMELARLFRLERVEEEVRGSEHTANLRLTNSARRLVESGRRLRAGAQAADLEYGDDRLTLVDLKRSEILLQEIGHIHDALTDNKVRILGIQIDHGLLLTLVGLLVSNLLTLVMR